MIDSYVVIGDTDVPSTLLALLMNPSLKALTIILGSCHTPFPINHGMCYFHVFILLLIFAWL